MKSTYMIMGILSLSGVTSYADMETPPIETQRGIERVYNEKEDAKDWPDGRTCRDRIRELELLKAQAEREYAKDWPDGRTCRDRTRELELLKSQAEQSDPASATSSRKSLDIVCDIGRAKNDESTIKTSVVYNGGEYYNVYKDKTLAANEYQRVTISKMRTKDKVIYEHFFTRMVECPQQTTETIAIIKDRKTGETESIISYPIGAWGRAKNEEKVYEILKGLYKKYRAAKKTDQQAADGPVIRGNMFSGQANAPCNNSSVASSPWKWGNHEHMEEHYEELKQLVFKKMGPDFVAAFNRQYPQSSKNAVEELARHFDYVSQWLESYPPQAIATIGSKETYLAGDIANIIYDMNGIPGRMRDFFTLNN